MVVRVVRAVMLLGSAYKVFCQGLDPVGLVTESKTAYIRRDGQSAAATAYRGDLLYRGDVLLAKGGRVTISSCPTQSSYLVSDGDIKVEKSHVSVAGKELRSAKTLAFCELPDIGIAQQGRLTYTDPEQIGADSYNHDPDTSKQV